MRKSAIALVPAFVLGLALSAAAQERPITTNKENKDTLRASVSGTVQLDYVWRSHELTGFTDSVVGAAPATADAENTFEGYLAIRMDVDLNDKVAAVVEFGTKRVDNLSINPWGTGIANPIQLREARVVVSDFLTPGLKLGVGIADWTFDVRGKGNSFAFDMRHSQSITRNLGTGVEGTGSLAGVGAGAAGTPDELEPVGFWLTWSNQQITLDLVMLPAVIEAGPASADETLYAIDFWYNLDSVGKGSRLGAILAASAFGPGHNTSIFTFGVGADLKFLDGNLEAYGEIYFQFGDAGIAGANDLKAKGMAGQFGAVYTIPNNPIWLGLNITYVTGDDDGTDNDVSRFASYENISDLAILEDMYLGLDIDSNYLAIKISGGFAMSLGAGKENLRLDAIIGIARALEDWVFGAQNEDALGTEVDIKAKWILTKQASLQLGIAFLFGSDILEQSMGGSGAPRAEDKAILYTLGAELKF